jgi:hypothetical protein
VLVSRALRTFTHKLHTTTRKHRLTPRHKLTPLPRPTLPLKPTATACPQDTLKGLRDSQGHTNRE